MTLDEANALLGRPASESKRMEGRLRVVTRVYPRDEGKLTAEFVEGILFRYNMTSE